MSRFTLSESNWSSIFSVIRQSNKRSLRWKSDAGPASSVEERDKNLYGGWKSYDLLVESGQEPSRSFVKRWDWHVFQFIVSFMPAAGIYLVAKQIEAGRKDAIADSQDSKDEDQATSIVLPGQQQSPNSDTHVEGPSSLQLMKERLDAIEDLLSGLVKQQQKTATSSSSVAEKNPES